MPKLKNNIENNRMDFSKAGITAKNLVYERNFMEYVKLLQLFSKRYTVFIVAADTPCGQLSNQNQLRELMKLGLKVNLMDKYRLSYAAAINEGKVIFENVSTLRTKAVEHEFVIGTTECKLFSAGYEVLHMQKKAYVKINNKTYYGARGLTFVVYDIITELLIDIVHFDTFSPDILCHRSSDLSTGIAEYQKCHPDIKVIGFSYPAFPNSHLSENETFILDHALGRSNILDYYDVPILPLNQYFKKDEFAEVLNAPKSYYDLYGVRRFEDTHGEFVNTIAGHRVTTDQPRSYERTIYIVGNCVVFGVGSSDKGTIASHLQRILNQVIPEQSYIVQNYGYYLAEVDARELEEVAILNSLPVKANDIVLCGFGMSKDIACIDLRHAGKRPHNYGEIFWDNGHFTERGNQLIAEKLFESLYQNQWIQKNISEDKLGHVVSYSEQMPLHKADKQQYQGIDNEEQQYLEDYKKILREFYNEKFNWIIGSVVMNCNPFTLGHRYLIEQAASQVDHLIIFVVQEDKSEFLFEDRLMLVDQGVADIKNVTVIPSGRFIISSLTFSEYFNKSEIQEREIDATLDVTIFAREIAPCLNISVRFVGEEPFDHVTRQYNDAMRTLLPQYGIQFVEIPRIDSLNHIPISASFVRKLLKEKNFIEIAKIVPRTTLEYLEKRYLKNH